MSYGLFSWYDVYDKYNAFNRLGTSPSPEQAKVPREAVHSIKSTTSSRNFVKRVTPYSFQSLLQCTLQRIEGWLADPLSLRAVQDADKKKDFFEFQTMMRQLGWFFSNKIYIVEFKNILL